MKQIYMQSKSPKSIMDVYSENDQMNFNPKTNRMKSSIASTGDEGKRKAIEHADNSNIFLNQNIGKGPPGRQRSPGVASFPEHPPDVQTNPVRVQKPDTIEEQLNQHINTNRIFSQRPLSVSKGRSLSESEGWSLSSSKGWFLSLPKGWSLSLSKGINTEQINYTNTKFYLQLNFTIMKKQIFILMVVLIASVKVAWAQPFAAHGVAPNPLTCGTSDALHPIAGKPYNYNIGVTPAPTGTAQYTWWATKGTDFILNGTVTNTGMLTITPGQILAATTPGYGVTGLYSTVTITWSSELLAGTASGTVAGKTPTFVAVNYTDPTSACANNLKVYQLDPLNGFTVDIFNRDAGGTLASGATTSSCVSNIASVTYNGSQLLYDYGTNTITYEVVAANFSSSWTPAFQVGALGNGQTADLQWAYDNAFTSGLVTVQSGIPTAGGTYTSTTVVNTNVPDTSIGVSIFVRLIIHNNTYEGIVDTPISLAVNGQNSAGQADVVNTDCNTTAYMEDIANQTLTKRPAVTATTPTGGFVPANTTN